MYDARTWKAWQALPHSISSCYWWNWNWTYILKSHSYNKIIMVLYALCYIRKLVAIVSICYDWNGKFSQKCLFDIRLTAFHVVKFHFSSWPIIQPIDAALDGKHARYTNQSCTFFFVEKTTASTIVLFILHEKKTTKIMSFVTQNVIYPKWIQQAALWAKLSPAFRKNMQINIRKCLINEWENPI